MAVAVAGVDGDLAIDFIVRYSAALQAQKPRLQCGVAGQSIGMGL